MRNYNRHPVPQGSIRVYDGYFREDTFERRYPNVRYMEDCNHGIRVAKEYEKNCKEERVKSCIRQIRFSLDQCNIKPLEMPNMEAEIPAGLPTTFIDTVYSLYRQTGLDRLGICYAILGSTSITGWGRVSAKLGDHWIEAGVDMLILVSRPGTRKTALAHELRGPFDAYGTQVNDGYEERQKLAQAKQRLGSKIAIKLDQQAIKEVLNETDMIDTDGIKKIKAVLDSVANKQTLLSDYGSTCPQVCLLVDNATPFQLAKTLQEQGECQGCITAEGSMLQGKLFRTTESVNLFLRGHTQEPYVYENAKCRIDLSHPALPMINIVQPIVAAKFYGDEQLNELGATARFIPYCFAATDEGDWETLPANDCNGQTCSSMDFYNKTIIRLLTTYHTQEKNAERYQVSVEPAALSRIRFFEEDIRKDIIPNMPAEAKPCLLKAHGQAVRFAWDIHAWNYELPHTVPITEEEMKQGIELVCASFEHIKYIYDPCGLQAYLHAQKILESLCNITEPYEQDKLINEGIDSSRIQRRTKLKSKDVNNALRLLETHNYLKVYDDATDNLKVILHSDFFV